MASNYPPGVTGNEPHFYPDDSEKCSFCKLGFSECRCYEEDNVPSSPPEVYDEGDNPSNGWRAPDVPPDLDPDNPVDLTADEWREIYSDPDFEDMEP